MNYDPEAFPKVERQFEAFCYALHELDAELVESYSSAGVDLEWACEQVTAAAEALVAAIAAWIPRLVPAPRALDEVLATIASWQSNEQSERVASNARALLEQLQAESYGQKMINPTGIPNLEEFIEDLRATLDVVQDALP